MTMSLYPKLPRAETLQLAKQTSLREAITITVRDVVDASVRLGLTASVRGFGSVVTGVVEGAGEERASILAVHIMVGVDEDTFGDAGTHSLAIIDSVDESEGEVAIALNSTSQVGECLVPARSGVVRGLGAVDTEVEQFEEETDELVLEPWDPMPAVVSQAIWLVAVVPSRDCTQDPRRVGRAVVICLGKGEGADI